MLDLLLFPPAVPAAPPAHLDLLMLGLGHGTGATGAALDLMLMMGADPGGVPPVTPAESIWRPTFRPRRR